MEKIQELVIRVRPDTRERRELIKLLREQTTVDWGDIMPGWRSGRSRGSERAIALMVYAASILDEGEPSQPAPAAEPDKTKPERAGGHTVGRTGLFG